MLFRVRTQWNIFFIKYESGPSLFHTTCVNFTVSWSVCNFKINLVFFFMFFFFMKFGFLFNRHNDSTMETRNWQEKANKSIEKVESFREMRFTK